MGARTTLFVGFVAVGVAAVIGVPLGILAAMATRWFGEVVMRANDLLLAFPALLLAIMFGAVFGAQHAHRDDRDRHRHRAQLRAGRARRVAAGDAHRVRPRRPRRPAVAGVSTAVRHVLPNVGSLVIVQASVSFAIAVLAEAALSFLGLGTPPPTPSWGRMLQESQELLFTAPRLALYPGVAIALAVLGFNLLGDGLRDRYDPRLEDRAMSAAPLESATATADATGAGGTCSRSRTSRSRSATPPSSTGWT